MSVCRYPSRMSSRKVDKVLTEAFSIWSSASGLKFRHQRTGKVHIEIRFERKDHGDEDPFDDAQAEIIDTLLASIPHFPRLGEVEPSAEGHDGGCCGGSPAHHRG